MKIMGIDMGGTNVRAGIVEDSKLLKLLSSNVDGKGTVEDVLKNIYSVVDPLIEKNIEGIGIGVPSVVNVEEGIVYNVQNIPSWKEVRLKEIMEDRYKTHVYVNNDANCFAVGEKYFGKVKNYKNAACITLGTGIGVGLILNGNLYSGSNCGAGEFGTIPYKDHTYEYYCSGLYFRNIYGIPGEVFFEQAKKKDKKALQIFSEFGEEVGNFINLILYSIDPEIIILGGSISKTIDFFKETMWKSVNQFEFPKALDKLKIEVSELNNSAILGAASLFYENNS